MTSKVDNPVYQPYRVYEIIAEYFEHRGLKMDGSLAGKDEFMTQFTSLDYMPLRAESVLAIIIRSNGRYMTSGPDLRKLIQRANSIAGGEINQVVIVAPEAFFAKKNLTDAVAAFPVAEVYPYNIFNQNVPKNEAVPRHSIASAEDIAEILSNRYATTAQLPKILKSDAAVVWEGGRVGDVIRIDRLSENVGTAPVYRLVISG